MPKFQLFHLGALLVVLLAFAAAVVAVIGPLRWAVALMAVVLVGIVITIVLSDRRTQISFNRRDRQR